MRTYNALENCTPVPEAGCWLWLGYIHSSGYGQLELMGKTWRVHRYFYTQLKGPIPNGLMVCHKCDTRSCVNPDHLFLGTHMDNMRDMARKGRANRPTATGAARRTAKRPACLNGHPYTDDTLRISNGKRRCRTCDKATYRRYYYRQKALSTLAGAAR